MCDWSCFDVTNDKADVEVKHRHIQTEEVETVEQGDCTHNLSTPKNVHAKNLVRDCP